VAVNKWSKNPPTEPGHYWWRGSKKERPHPQWVAIFDGDLIAFRNTNVLSFERIGGEWWPERIEPPVKE
jgi:hypothetical protein